MVGIGVVWRRANDILRKEGLKEFLVLGSDFFASRLFKYEEYYLYEHTMKPRDEKAFLPATKNFELRLICTAEEADKLAEATGFDFRRRSIKGRERLTSGCIAFVVLVEGKLAHIGWVALDERGKKALDLLPYKVDFAARQACTGGTYTFPEFRDKKLMAYGYYEWFEFLRKNGFTTSRNAVEANSIPSQKTHVKFGPTVLGKAGSRTVLGLKFWKERPLAPDDLPAWLTIEGIQKAEKPMGG
jgi:hypothetical protein